MITPINTKLIGTITWFDVNKIKPESNENISGAPLKTYLVAYNGMAISVANFDPYFDMFINYNLPDTPTHWAHINWPA